MQLKWGLFIAILKVEIFFKKLGKCQTIINWYLINWLLFMIDLWRSFERIICSEYRNEVIWKLSLSDKLVTIWRLNTNWRIIYILISTFPNLRIRLCFSKTKKIYYIFLTLILNLQCKENGMGERVRSTHLVDGVELYRVWILILVFYTL